MELAQLDLNLLGHCSMQPWPEDRTKRSRFTHWGLAGLNFITCQLPEAGPAFPLLPVPNYDLRTQQLSRLARFNGRWRPLSQGSPGPQ